MNCSVPAKRKVMLRPCVHEPNTASASPFQYYIPLCTTSGTLSSCPPSWQRLRNWTLMSEQQTFQQSRKALNTYPHMLLCPRRACFRPHTCISTAHNTTPRTTNRLASELAKSRALRKSWKLSSWHAALGGLRGWSNPWQLRPVAVQ